MEDCLNKEKNGVICRKIMDLKIIKISSIRQSQRDGYHESSRLCGSDMKKEERQMWKYNRNYHRERECWGREVWTSLERDKGTMDTKNPSHVWEHHSETHQFYNVLILRKQKRTNHRSKKLRKAKSYMPSAEPQPIPLSSDVIFKCQSQRQGGKSWT